MCLINASVYRPAIGPVDTGSHSFHYSLTAFAVRLFTVANGVSAEG